MIRNLAFLFIVVPLGLSAQFSLNAAFQHHSNVFSRHGQSDRDKPFTTFWQYGGGASWQWRWLNFSGTITGLRMQENLRASNYEYWYGSFGGPGWSSGGNRSARLALLYVGIGLEANAVLFHQRRFNLLLGISAHGDHKFSEKQTGYSEYTTNGYTYDSQDAVDARMNYVYWSLGVRPRFWTRNKRLYAELSFALNYYNQPRIINNMRNSQDGDNYSGDPAFYAAEPLFGFFSRYISNQIGISIGYRIGPKSKIESAHLNRKES